MAILGFSIVVLHLIIGFGFMMYKLSPKAKKVPLEPTEQKTLNKKEK